MTRRFEIHRERSDTIAGVLWDDGQASTMCDGAVDTWDDAEQARQAWSESDTGEPVEATLKFLDEAEVKLDERRIRVHRYSDGHVLIGDDEENIVVSPKALGELRKLLEELT